MCCNPLAEPHAHPNMPPTVLALALALALVPAVLGLSPNCTCAQFCNGTCAADNSPKPAVVDMYVPAAPRTQSWRTHGAHPPPRPARENEGGPTCLCGCHTWISRMAHTRCPAPRRRLNARAREREREGEGEGGLTCPCGSCPAAAGTG